MQILKKPLSILLSLVMILSVFTIIPMSASAEGDGELTPEPSVIEDQDHPALLLQEERRGYFTTRLGQQ